jgi:hypothetical protein
MDQEPIDLTLKDVYQLHLDMTRLIYFDYMALCKDGDFPSFMEMHLDYVKTMLNLLDDRYADHVEGINREIMEHNRSLPDA